MLVGDCSRTTPGGCKSEDQCFGLGDSTTRFPNAGAQYVDENNYCHVYVWNSGANRCLTRRVGPNYDGSVNYYCQ